VSFFEFTNDLSSKGGSAGATKPFLELKAPEGTNLLNYKAWMEGRMPFHLEGYYLTFAPSGAKMARKGRTTSVQVTVPGEGRVAIILSGWCHRKVEGHTPKVWHTSSSKCVGGLLLVCSPGFQFEVCDYRRPWRRFEVQPDGWLKEVVQEEVTLD
jgi:hypothetical protein